MDDQTTEQLKSIVAGAPKGAKDYFVWNGEFSYGIGDGFFNGTTKCESLIGAKPSTRLLSDILEIIALRKANAGLREDISIAAKIMIDITNAQTVTDDGYTVGYLVTNNMMNGLDAFISKSLKTGN